MKIDSNKLKVAEVTALVSERLVRVQVLKQQIEWNECRPMETKHSYSYSSAHKHTFWHGREQYVKAKNVLHAPYKSDTCLCTVCSEHVHRRRKVQCALRTHNKTTTWRRYYSIVNQLHHLAPHAIWRFTRRNNKKMYTKNYKKKRI